MARLNRTDVVVAGGGITGMAAALGLARAGRRVLVLDPSPPAAPEADAPAGLRVSTFSPASIALLERLQAWQRVDRERIHPFHTMRVWEREPLEALTFTAADGGLPCLGAVAENERVRHGLWSAAEGVVEIRHQRLEGIDPGPESVRLRLDDGSRLKADLLVGADGARSPVREAMGVEVRSHDYFQSGVVAVIEADAGHRQTAWQRFLPDGPLAFLPLGPGQVSIVWSVPASTAARLCELSDEDFAARLQDASQGVLGRLRPASRRVAFPLRRVSAARYLSGRCVLVGDAARQVHPLAGQGVNLGLRDAAVLAESLAGDGPDAGLRRYERRRRSDAELMSLGLHALRAIYAWQGPAGELRRAGTRLLNHIGPLRRAFIQRASGLGPDRPPGAAPSTGPDDGEQLSKGA